MNPSRDFFQKKLDEFQKVDLAGRWNKINKEVVPSLSHIYKGSQQLVINFGLIRIMRYFQSVIVRLEELKHLPSDISIAQINDDILEISLNPESPSLHFFLVKIVSDLQMVIEAIKELKKKSKSIMFQKQIETLQKLKKEISLFIHTLIQSLEYFLSFRAEPVENGYYTNAIVGREAEFNQNFIGNLPTATRLNLPTNRNAPLGRHPSVLARRSKKIKPPRRTHSRATSRANRSNRPVQGSRI
jgi:hypothetical protein